MRPFHRHLNIQNRCRNKEMASYFAKMTFIRKISCETRNLWKGLIDAVSYLVNSSTDFQKDNTIETALIRPFHRHLKLENRCRNKEINKKILAANFKGRITKIYVKLFFHNKKINCL